MIDNSKIPLIKKLSKLKENSERQFEELIKVNQKALARWTQ